MKYERWETRHFNFFLTLLVQWRDHLLNLIGFDRDVVTAGWKKIFGPLSICVIGSDVLNRDKSFSADYLSALGKENLWMGWVLERDPKWALCLQAKSPSLKSCAKQRYMERMSALPESERKSFTIPIYDRIVATMMWSYFFQRIFDICYLFSSFLCCTFSSHLHEFSHFGRGIFWNL